MGSTDPSSSKKKIAIIGVSSILLVAAVVGTVTYVVNNRKTEGSPAGNGGQVLASSKAVHEVCQKTNYKETCEKSLAKAKNPNDPKELIQVALQAGIDSVKEVTHNSSALKEADKNPSVAAAFDVCEKVLDFSIHDLERSIEKIGAFDKTKFDEYMDDLRTWLSGAVTFQEDCLDAFDNTTGETGEKMKQLMKTTRELSSNGLAMIGQLSEIFSSSQIPGVNSRRLLEDGNSERILYEDYYPPEPNPPSVGKGPGRGMMQHVTRKLFEDGNSERILYNDYYPPESNPPRIGKGPGRGMMQHATRKLFEDGNSERILYNDYYPPESNPPRIGKGPGRGMMQHATQKLFEDGNSERILYNDYYPPKPNPPRIGKGPGRGMMQNDYYHQEQIKTRKIFEDGNSGRILYNDYYPPESNPPRIGKGPGRGMMQDDYYHQEPIKTRKLFEDGKGRRNLYDDYYPPENNPMPGVGKGRRILYDYYPPEFPQPGVGKGRGMMQDYYPLENHVRNLLQADPHTLKPNAIVALDGSGHFKSIQASVNTAPKKVNQTFLILIKAGVYHEIVEIPKYVYNIVFLGEGPTRTRITGRKNVVDGLKTWNTATVGINGDNFIARDIGFENSAGAIKHQAAAVRVSADKSIFYNCHFDGFQDTLYIDSHRQFFRDCTISGTIDFIFGDASAMFQNCKIVVRKPLDGQFCTVTAQGRKEPTSKGAIVLQNCTIVPDRDYFTTKNVAQAYLGRPWKEFSRTIVMQSFIDGFIAPEGWYPWAGNLGLDTLQYGEYQNRGPGANTNRRVRWKGIRHITPQSALSFTPGSFIEGRQWIQGSGIPYEPGMIRV